MASSDEGSCSSDENEASFASLEEEEESSMGSSSSSEYVGDELSEEDDNKENNSLNDDDEDSLDGLIDPEADQYELKPARMNKFVEEEPPEEPSDVSCETFGEEEDNSEPPAADQEQRQENAVVVVDVQEVGEEEDEEIVVVDAEIIVDEDGEQCKHSKTPKTGAPVDHYEDDDTIILSDEPEIQEGFARETYSQDVATSLDLVDPSPIRMSLQQGQEEIEAKLELLNSPSTLKSPIHDRDGHLGITMSSVDQNGNQPSEAQCSSSDVTSPHKETDALMSPSYENDNEKKLLSGHKSRSFTQDSLPLDVTKENLAPKSSETTTETIASPHFQSEEITSALFVESANDPMNIDGTLHSGGLSTSKESPLPQPPTPKTQQGHGLDHLHDHDSAVDEESASVRDVEPTNQESMISAFASLRLEQNLGVTSPPLRSLEPNKSILTDIAERSGCQTAHREDGEITPGQNTKAPCCQKSPKSKGKESSNVSSTVQNLEKTGNRFLGTNATKQRPSRIRREGSIKRGQWRLVKKIGSGSFGIVHLGINTHSGSMMAVKSVRMDAVAMKDSKREIQLMKALDHKNVVKYFGAEMNGQHLHIFQEWIPAGSIASLLAMVGPFPLGVMREYLLQVLEGLAYLHENNIVHRDIKGSNLLVTDKGIVKLADFGAGKQLCKLRMESLMAMTCRGTPYFMAPEVFEQIYSAKADIWSVGCVGVQMATGRPPWKDMGFSSHLTLFRHISSIAQPPLMEMNADVIVGVQDGQARFEMYKDAIGKCFHLIPSERPSAVDLLNDRFFQAENSWSIGDESECSRLFSPSPGRKSLSPRPPVPSSISPIIAQNQRLSNERPFSSPLASPPLLANNKRNSLTPDTSDWPSWAKRSHADAEKTKAKRYGDIAVDPLNSLSYSCDGQMKENGSDRIEVSSTEESSALIGLEFMNSINSARGATCTSDQA